MANTEDYLKAVQQWLIKITLVVALITCSAPIAPSVHFISASPATELRILHNVKIKRTAFYRSFVASPDLSFHQIINATHEFVYTLLASARTGHIHFKTASHASPSPAVDQSFQILHSRAKSQDPDLIQSRG